jgi:MOSC domain-containing protein YiiM
LPVEGPVMVNFPGIEGDEHRNREIHGGPNKAVLMIASEKLDELVAKGFPVYPGALGENLTVRGLDPREWHTGQRFRIGDQVVVELTKLRQPCVNLHVYGRPIVKELLDAENKPGGFYARVIVPGPISPGLAIIEQT